ncbi:MAG: flagella biosynthesis chaperone FliJ [Enterobacteriaceae bacterium]|jgi:flagellar FliJ protein|nr:flagella biosynthesis chaperone FliJ [Enterobacteriaceae bacterium]
MSASSPINVLCNLAEQKLNDTTTRLGRARQKHADESDRLTQLQDYEHEYRRRLQDNIAEKGVSVVTLQTYQGFIGALGRVVAQQAHEVSARRNAVEDTLSVWQKDRQRLKAFETLKQRADEQRELKENRQEQKMMDEFARRASQRKA